MPSGVYVIIDPAVARAPLALLEAVLRAGVSFVQLRAKGGIDRGVLGAMLDRTRAARARLIVNDDLVAALEADGWHAGQEDLAGLELAAVREQLGPRLWGISCGTPDEARAAERAGADYVGTGPFAATETKADAGPAIGVAGLTAVVAAVGIPVVAIGGIGAHNIAAVARTGARMAAVISSIATAADPEAATRSLQAAWRAAS